MPGANYPATTTPWSRSAPNRSLQPPDARAAWHEALAALGPAGDPHVRGMPDGRLLHLRDTYPVETAWAPRYVEDELRQVRVAAWDARLAGLRAAAEARAAEHRGDHDHAAAQHALAVGYQALEQGYRQREAVFAQTMADRADWDQATRAQRQLAVAADAELRRRHPGQYFSPLRSAEPAPATGTQHTELYPDQPRGEIDQRITDLAAGHRTFADMLADRQSQTMPSEDPDYGDLGPAFPARPGPDRPGPGADLAAAQARDPAVPADPPEGHGPRHRLGSRRLTAAVWHDRGHAAVGQSSFESAFAMRMTAARDNNADVAVL